MPAYYNSYIWASIHAYYNDYIGAFTPVL
jgi:hypothetical protein